MLSLSPPRIHLLLALLLPFLPMTSQAACDKPCEAGKVCQPPTAAPPASHLGAHVCGGTYTETLKDGGCIAGLPTDSCEQKTGTFTVGMYSCAGSGGNCTHLLIGTSTANACGC